MMIGFGISEVNLMISGAFFVAILFVSSGSQKKENLEIDFGCGDDGDRVTFDGEAISFDSAASEFQKKDRSEMSFIRGGHQ